LSVLDATAMIAADLALRNDLVDGKDTLFLFECDLNGPATHLSG
jgi:hypothetical protein